MSKSTYKQTRARRRNYLKYRLKCVYHALHNWADYGVLSPKERKALRVAVAQLNSILSSWESQTEKAYESYDALNKIYDPKHI